MYLEEKSVKCRP